MKMIVGDSYQAVYICDSGVFGSFLEAFNDRNLMHVSDQHAQRIGFPAKVMHGNILNGFCSHFVGEIFPVKNVMITSQEIKFRNPFYLNDKLLFSGELVAFTESVKLAQIKFKFERASDSKKIANGHLGVIIRD